MRTSEVAAVSLMSLSALALASSLQRACPPDVVVVLRIVVTDASIGHRGLEKTSHAFA